jgi:hypothetical protein
MKLNSFAAVAGALDEAGVRYLVAGGLAVNAHGYLRFTKDVDLVVQLVPDNIVIDAFVAEPFPFDIVVAASPFGLSEPVLELP